MDRLERLLSKVVVDSNGCWVWQGYVMPSGYGQFVWSKRDIRLAHRASYELIIGNIPEGLHVHHKCEHTRCTNPDHLEVVTQQQNNAYQSQKTHCPKGHEYTRDNMLIRPNGEFKCRECNRVQCRNAYLKPKASGYRRGSS